MSAFPDARFVAGAAELSQLPRVSKAEVAFAGRSNAGKSSAINALLQRKGLAFVSKTPGRTQQINYFDLGDHRYLVDLPGYGYARVAKAEQARWEQLLPTYLQTRSALRGLILIMDIRHPLTPLDELLLEVFAPTGKPIHVLMTKSDKLARAAARSAWLKVQSELGSRPIAVSCQPFSSSSLDGVEDARTVIAGWLRDDPPQRAPNKKPPVKGE